MYKGVNVSETIATTQSDLIIPKHVAIIMDGNGRWAQMRGDKRVAGHKAGVESVRQAVTTARKLGVEALTLFAFSSENWQRPEKEVSVLMDLFMYVLTKEVKRLHKNGIRFKVIGDLSRFSAKLQSNIVKAQELTKDNKGMVLSVAANYGGRWDITHAAKQLAAKVQAGEMSVEEITEQSLDAQTSLAEFADLDLLIRTGGDYRISNFLLWQSAYAEFYFTETLWPDFDENQFQLALEAFTQRERRFGKTGDQVKQK